MQPEFRQEREKEKKKKEGNRCVKWPGVRMCMCVCVCVFALYGQWENLVKNKRGSGLGHREGDKQPMSLQVIEIKKEEKRSWIYIMGPSCFLSVFHLQAPTLLPPPPKKKKQDFQIGEKVENDFWRN